LEDKEKLFAVNVHSGSTLSSGHYYAFIQFAGQWYKCNDMQVIILKKNVYPCTDKQNKGVKINI
jgi:ubiquitin C-terminal hydrolase